VKYRHNNRTGLPDRGLSPAALEFLSHCSVSSGGLPLWDGGSWPGAGGVPTPNTIVSDTENGKVYNIQINNGQLRTTELPSGTAISVTVLDPVSGLFYQVQTVNGTLAIIELASGTEQNNIINDALTAIAYRLYVKDGDLATEEL